MQVILQKRELEPAVAALNNWIRCLRLGVLSAQIGSIKGIIQPLAEGAYYDREALVDEHALWEWHGEGDQKQHRRVAKEISVNGEKVGESVSMKDTRIFNKAVRELLDQEITVTLPFLLEDRHVKESATNASKDTSNLPTVDFGALRCLWNGSARIAE